MLISNRRSIQCNCISNIHAQITYTGVLLVHDLYTVSRLESSHRTTKPSSPWSLAATLTTTPAPMTRGHGINDSLAVLAGLKKWNANKLCKNESLKVWFDLLTTIFIEYWTRVLIFGCLSTFSWWMLESSDRRQTAGFVGSSDQSSADYNSRRFTSY